VEAFVAEDGKQYLFDSEANKWVTPEEKIEEDLEALREAAGEPEPGITGSNSSSRNVVSSTASKKRAADADATQDGAALVDGASASADALKKKKKKSKKKSDKWKARKKNTWVYVNGLPLDVTVQEVHEHFSKCGVIQQDVTSGEPRIKLYRSKQFDGLNVSATLVYSVQLLRSPHSLS
jgi:HIV Tat-specific factor 1